MEKRLTELRNLLNTMFKGATFGSVTADDLIAALDESQELIDQLQGRRYKLAHALALIANNPNRDPIAAMAANVKIANDTLKEDRATEPSARMEKVLPSVAIIPYEHFTAISARTAQDGGDYLLLFKSQDDMTAWLHGEELNYTHVNARGKFLQKYIADTVRYGRIEQ